MQNFMEILAAPRFQLRPGCCVESCRNQGYSGESGCLRESYPPGLEGEFPLSDSVIARVTYPGGKTSWKRRPAERYPRIHQHSGGWNGPKVRPPEKRRVQVVHAEI